MNLPYPHVIAKSNEKVIGYVLIMTPNLKNEIPVLIPMFEQMNALQYKGENLGESAYVVMGQVCIEKSFRGKGVFAALYEKMCQILAKDFQYILTEISPRNRRSLRAH